jgi:hypothetical protein
MLSVFQSREFGFGFWKLTKEEMVRINLHRRGANYVDEQQYDDSNDDNGDGF